MADNDSVSYEVYVLSGGRWQILSRYGENGKDTAILIAKKQEEDSSVVASCVIRESYRASDNAAMESVIYHSASLGGAPSVRAVTRGEAERSSGKKPYKVPPQPASAKTASPAVERSPASNAGPAKPPARSAPVERPGAMQGGAPVKRVQITPSQAFVRFCFVLALSIFFGLMTGAIVFFIVKGASFGLSGDQLQMIVVMAGLVGAASCFYPLLRIFVPDVDWGGMADPGAVAAVAAAGGPSGMAVVPDADPDAVGDDAGTDPSWHREAGEEPAGTGAQEPAGSESEPAPPPTPPSTVLPGAAQALAETEGDGDDEGGDDSNVEDQEASEDEEEAAADAAAELRAEDEEEEEPVGTSERNLAIVEAELGALAEEARDLYQDNHGQIDPYRCFGITLFLAGSGESLSRWHHVTRKTLARSLAGIVEGLGMTSKSAAGYSYHIDEYLLDPRFRAMYAAGTSSAIKRVDDKQAPTGLKEAMDVWVQPLPPPVTDPEDEDPQSAVSVVLLTRIYYGPSPNLEEANTRYATLRKAHDDIVRDALSRSGGIELKHTVDGTLASFDSPIAGIAAAVAIQKVIRQLREISPERAPEVRIGVASGIPIHLGSDPRRTPVKLATRMVQRSRPGDIVVAQPIPKQCKGTEFRFKRLGTFLLPGLNDAQKLYRVLWN